MADLDQLQIESIEVTDPRQLQRYESVSMSLMVGQILDVSDLAEGAGTAGGFLIRKRDLQDDHHYLKDFKSDGDPIRSLRPFLCAHNNGGFLATIDETPVGGALGLRACSDAGYFCMTDGRADVAVLADIRVANRYQNAGIGRQLFGAVVEWARSEGMRLLKIETQNTNVAACYFYQKMGATLGGVQRHAYSDSNGDEVMLLYFLEL